MEYQRILGRLTDDGRTAVATAVRLFNGYGEQLGVSANYGRKVKATGTPAPSLDEVRRRAANY